MNTELYEKIREAWNMETCYPKFSDKWSDDIPELGQCAVTALFIQEVYGGKILYNKKYNHYWNELPSGEELDLTRKQFNVEIMFEDMQVSRDEILSIDTTKRYNLLKQRIGNEFADCPDFI